MIKNCSHCNKEIIRIESRFRFKNNFCNRFCYNEFRRKGIPNAEIICKTCGTKFIVPPSRIKKAKFCNKICYADWIHKNRKGENHPQFKGGYELRLWHNSRGFHTLEEWINLKKRFNFKCLKCGKPENAE